MDLSPSDMLFWGAIACLSMTAIAWILSPRFRRITWEGKPTLPPSVKDRYGHVWVSAPAPDKPYRYRVEGKTDNVSPVCLDFGELWREWLTDSAKASLHRQGYFIPV